MVPLLGRVWLSLVTTGGRNAQERKVQGTFTWIIATVCKDVWFRRGGARTVCLLVSRPRKPALQPAFGHEPSVRSGGRKILKTLAAARMYMYVAGLLVLRGRVGVASPLSCCAPTSPQACDGQQQTSGWRRSTGPAGLDAYYYDYTSREWMLLLLSTVEEDSSSIYIRRLD